MIEQATGLRWVSVDVQEPGSWPPPRSGQVPVASLVEIESMQVTETGLRQPDQLGLVPTADDTAEPSTWPPEPNLTQAIDPERTT